MTARRDYLLEVGERLWPPQVRTAGARPGPAPGTRSYLLVPSAEHPQLVLPAGSARAAASAVAGFTGHRSGLAGLRSRGLSWGLRAGLGDRLLTGRLVVGPEPGIESYLASVLGEEPLLAMHVGPARANRKPVLQLLDRSGRVLGFAKIGTGPLTDELVDREARALARLADRPLPGVRVPRLLHHGRWRDLDVLVQAGLPVRGAGQPTPGQLATAMIAVADSGPQHVMALRESEFVAQLIADLGNHGESGRTLAADLTAVRAVRGDRSIRLGTGHGDWTRWNCALGADGHLLVWDWERYAEGVPRGLDALHHRLQSGAVDAVAAAELFSAADRLLRPFRVDAYLTTLLYLAEIARRYLQDGQSAAGNRRGDVGRWLIPVVHQQVSRLTEPRS